MITTPFYSLAEVVALAVAGRWVVKRGSALDRLAPRPFPTRTEALNFLCDLLRAIRTTDFVRGVVLRDGETGKHTRFDEYAVAVGTDVCERHGIDGKTTWYVKFTIGTDDQGRVLIVISAHCLEKPARRVNGTTLNPSWKESDG